MIFILMEKHWLHIHWDSPMCSNAITALDSVYQKTTTPTSRQHHGETCLPVPMVIRYNWWIFLKCWKTQLQEWRQEIHMGLFALKPNLKSLQWRRSPSGDYFLRRLQNLNESEQVSAGSSSLTIIQTITSIKLTSVLLVGINCLDWTSNKFVIGFYHWFCGESKGQYNWVASAPSSPRLEWWIPVARQVKLEIPN